MKCTHPVRENRRKLNLLRQWVVHQQCANPECLRDCGKVNLGEWNHPEDFPLWRQRRRPTRRKREYRDRFKRKDWAELRRQCLEDADHECACCGEEATQAHHTSYRNFGKGGEAELRDLVAACAACNRYERELRVSRGALG